MNIDSIVGFYKANWPWSPVTLETKAFGFKYGKKETHRSAQTFLEYARKNYVGVSADGKLEWVTNYYDPLVGFTLNGPVAGAMSTAFLLAPQNREFAAFLYEAAVNAGGHRAPNAQVRANAGMLSWRANWVTRWSPTS